MRKMALALALLGLLAMPTMAQPQNVPPQHLSITRTDGWLESGWVVSVPSGSSDHFNVRYDGLANRPLIGVAVGSADFGSGTSYPKAGFCEPNLALDPSGNTPDLFKGVSVGPIAGGGVPGGGGLPAFNYVYGSFGSGWVTFHEDPVHVLCQFPPGDSGTLAIGADENPPCESFSGWTLDNYQTPSIRENVDWGLNAVVWAIRELQEQPDPPNSYLHFYLSWNDETGDFRYIWTAAAGVFVGTVYQTSLAGSLWQLWQSFLGVPIKRLSPTLFTFPSGGGGYLRAGDFWPVGFGGLTFNFVAVGGKPGVPGSLHVSNEVTLQTLPDAPCTWGRKDDGSIESGWVVSVPSGSSDYFSNWFNCMVVPPITTVTDFKLSVMDFGTTATSYPSSGVHVANTAIDPSGWTPDLSFGWAVAPFTFVPFTFATTSGMYVQRDFADIPYVSFGTDNVHGVIRFPPGDSGWLGVGADTNSGGPWGSSWTFNGYSTPANRFDTKVGWGLRLGAR
ncbi:MAG: hypothetical protein AB1486_03485 [Planctomycetota bacterium]